MARDLILMVYPKLGMAGSFVAHPPLGLLYASCGVVESGFEVRVLDLRLPGQDLRRALEAESDRILAVGVSVMTGSPIASAMRIGAMVKSVDPAIKVVWGGAFTAHYPELPLQGDANCDYVISGYGEKAFAGLIRSLAEGREPIGIPGAYLRGANGDVTGTPADWSRHEHIHYSRIPYQLIDIGAYGQLDQRKRIVPIYSAMGCAYNCAFCSSPALYSQIKGKRWAPFDPQEVADHVQFVTENFGADYIYFIDDDSFVSLDHVIAVIAAIRARNLHVKLGFRGARINEIKRMDDAFLETLAEAGTDILHIGAESGSNRILELVRKNCTVEDILACNRKLARHDSISALYNFIVGLPGETLDDLRTTAGLMRRLAEENPRAIICTPNKFRPLSGTELFELACSEYGYQAPDSLEEFATVEVEGSFDLPWIDAQMARYCDLMLISSYFVDDKVLRLTTGRKLFYRLMRGLHHVYAPVAKYRLKHFEARLFLERPLYHWASSIMSRGARM